MAEKLRKSGKLTELFGLDLRSLALFRMGLALTFLMDLCVRFQDLRAHYTDVGILPRSYLIDNLMNSWYWSINLISGQPLVQALIFITAILMGIAMLVGYRTRLATIACWVLLISIQNRNYELNFAADDVFRALFFWSMFLPLGATYSIDSALNTSKEKLPKNILTGATFAFTIQQCFIYIFSVVFKASSPIWFPDGDAVYYALQFDPYATPVGQILLNAPPLLLKLITYATLVLEGIGPLFLFVPVYTAFFRGATVISFIFLHVIFGLCFIIGVFPLLSSASWLAFIPTAFWDNLEKRLDIPQRNGLTIYYDKECGFCKKVVYLLRTFLVLPRTTLLAAQEREDASIYADMQEYNSWVVVDWQRNRRFKWDAMCYVVSLSPVFKPLASILRFPPLFSVGTKFYEIIARNRRTAGIFTRPLKFRPMVVRPSLILNIIALLLIFATFFWNIRTFAQRTYERRAVRQNDWISFTYHLFNRRTIQSVDWISRLTRLDQGWSIFAPAPPRDDGWHVIPGKLKDGSEVDVLRGLEKPVSWEKPTMQERNALYGDMHWRTFFIALNRAIGKKLYPPYARYLCREWNSKHEGDKKLESFEIFFMNERTVPPGEKQTVEKESHWKQDCQ